MSQQTVINLSSISNGGLPGAALGPVETELGKLAAYLDPSNAANTTPEGRELASQLQTYLLGVQEWVKTSCTGSFEMALPFPGTFE